MTAPTADISTIRRAGHLPPGSLAMEVSGVGSNLLRLGLDGELDAASARAVRALVGPLFRAAPRIVEIDLRGLSFIDMSGLRAVEGILARAEHGGCRIVLHPPGACARIASRLVRDAGEAHGAIVSAVPPG